MTTTVNNNNNNNNNDWKEVQLRISENGEMSVMGIQEAEQIEVKQSEVKQSEAKQSENQSDVKQSEGKQAETEQSEVKQSEEKQSEVKPPEKQLAVKQPEKQSETKQSQQQTKREPPALKLIGKNGKQKEMCCLYFILSSIQVRARRSTLRRRQQRPLVATRPHHASTRFPTFQK